MRKKIILPVAILSSQCMFSCSPKKDIPITFAPPYDLAAGTVHGVSSLDAQDIDNDGFVDVAVIEGGKHARGKTFAWFQAPAQKGENWVKHEFNTDAPLKLFLGSAKLVDVDNDDDMDLVVSSDNHSGAVMDTDMFVFVNPLPDGDVYAAWNFVYIAKALPYHHINDMEVADMDGDGKTDVIVRSLEPNEIHIFFQDDPENWQIKSIPTLLEQSEGLAVADLDGDKLPDISYTGFVLRSPKNPRTDEYVRIAVDADYHTVNQNTKEAIGDIDGDGLPDILFSPAEKYRQGQPHDLAWYGNPGGDLTAAWQKNVIMPQANNMHTAKLADLDGDDDLDVIVGIAWDDKAVEIFYNTGKGAFSQPHVLCTDKGLYSGIIADLGNDGDLDIIGQDTYASDSKPYVYESLRK